jgi:Major intrinsic protein
MSFLVCVSPAFTGCGVNPARTLGPSAVVCMSGGDCDAVMGTWYWIYWAGPFLAALAVAEVTLILEMDVDGEVALIETTKEEERLLDIAAKTAQQGDDVEQIAQLADA